MTNEMEVAKQGQNPLESLFTSGDEVVSGHKTRLPLSGKLAKKGNYLVGKYLGMKRITPKDGSEPFSIADFAVLETNMEGDTGGVVAGEVCTVGVSGLLAWGLNKVAEGRIVAVRFDGKGPGVAKDGTTKEMNRYTVRDVTDAMGVHGVS